jgi:hypothetical protein
MALTSDDKIQSSPRASKDPKSYEYARQMVYVLKTIWTQITFDLKDWEKEVEEARRNKIWERLGYGSIDEVLKEEVGYSKQELSLKIKAAKADPLAKNGTNQHSDIGDRIADARHDPLSKPVGCNNITPSIRGTGTDYTLRRLARDCPEMLDKIEAGELSVNAAAIAAGIRKKPTQAEICVKAFRKAENRMEALRLITSELQPHEAAVVRDWIAERLQ